jgi:hypothetical protein
MINSNAHYIMQKSIPVLTAKKQSISLNILYELGILEMGSDI